ncbi:hypothetical protein [Azospirillum thermophilum]|uniref:Uncharacterized protein n=1 Tax=Azospirillum thermophilum TaxID=2202148 RepID=A0A2S2CRH3_9PROT|nr:hypothetical protein [Azospirillum thermophilum]AWK87114.1 hypothetical protein DEW08_13565 [Azospirillum thermophilum]
MQDFAMDHVRSFIARPRVAEMQARGWRIVGPGEEGSLLMEGPQPGGRPEPVGLFVGDLFDEMIARALARADAADAMTAAPHEARPHRRAA